MGLIDLTPAVQLRYLTASCAQAEAARGVREHSPNWGPEIRGYLANCQPPIPFPAAWCAAFVQAMADRAAIAVGIQSPLNKVAREAYVQDYHEFAKRRGWIVSAGDADYGDLVLYRFGSRWDHIGFLLRPADDKGDLITVEGNTSPGVGATDTERERDGDGVYTKLRSMRRGYSVEFVRWDVS